jgi:hypothetical protein
MIGRVLKPDRSDLKEQTGLIKMYYVFNPPSPLPYACLYF